jgi:hypothetical protein
MSKPDHSLPALLIAYADHPAIGALYEMAFVIQIGNNLLYECGFFQRDES